MPSVTVDQITPDIFRMEIPLSMPALKSVNSYVIRNGERSLIVDTGMNQPGCLEAFQDGLDSLGILIEKSDLFITHAHGDHMGLAGMFATAGNRVFLNGLEMDAFRQFLDFESIIAHFVRHGFPENRVKSATKPFPWGRGAIHRNLELEYDNVGEGDEVRVGDLLLVCIHTPGHSMGHTCLHDPARKILFSGDHILGDISPGIQCVSDDINPIGSYLESLEKIKQLDIEMILPGHRSIIREPKKRIHELVLHHRKRCEEVLRIVAKGKKSAYEVAMEMKWDLPFVHWEAVPDVQKWFASGEALSHLRYLEVEGRIRRSAGGAPVTFTILS